MIQRIKKDKMIGKQDEFINFKDFSYMYVILNNSDEIFM